MPVDISYHVVFADILMRGGVVFPWIAISCYRISSVSLFPCLSNRKSYWTFCLLMVALYSLVDARNAFAVFIFVLMVLAPSIVIGSIEMARKWRCYFALISCIIELLLLPVWFFIVFMVTLLIEGGD